MKLLDIILLIPLIWGAYSGYKKGLVMTLFKILSLMLGIILGFKLVHWGAEMLKPHIGDAKGFLPIISFILIFLAIIIGVNILGKIIKKSLEFVLLGTFDGIAGAILNMFKWAFMIGIGFWLMEGGGIELPKDLTEDTYIYKYIVLYSPKMLNFFSSLMPFAKDLVEYIENMKI